jgi:hypothetical protein
VSGGCAVAEALLAEHVLARRRRLPAELIRHLASCAACLRLARELQDPRIAGELARAAIALT